MKQSLQLGGTLFGNPFLGCYFALWQVAFVDAEGQGDRDTKYDTMLFASVILTSKVWDAGDVVVGVFPRG